MEDDDSGGPSIELVLSRSSYRVGQPVVGTVRLLVAPAAAGPPNRTPRDVFSDAYMFVAGWCRLDPRWHNQLQVAEYSKRNESSAVHFNLQNRRGITGNVEIDDHCVCFWTTNVVPLMDLQERTIGKWEDVKPKPIGGRSETSDSSSSNNNSCTNTATATAETPLDENQLAFTFRADLPIDIPHSFQAVSCRYFYAVMVETRVRLSSSSSTTSRKQWLRHGLPIQVLSVRPDQPPPTTSIPTNNTFPLGSCMAMAHSKGLPFHVTATDLHSPTGQLLVNRRGAASLGSLVTSQQQSHHVQGNHSPAAATTAATATAQMMANNLQTMRITDLNGTPCCVLTVMGVSLATPGSRMVLKFDFPTPRSRDDETLLSQWAPCYHVSASLEGQEVAHFVDGSKKRAQAYQWDTAHAAVDPECTERVCLSLLVPLNAPTTLKTNAVEVSSTCSIDVTIGGGSSDPGKFHNLRLQLPCRIVNGLSEYEMLLSGEDVEQDEDDLQLKLPLDELILGCHRSSSIRRSDYLIDSENNTSNDGPPLVETKALQNTNDFTHPSSFVTKDIRQDLKILSLRMAKECNLIEPSPPY